MTVKFARKLRNRFTRYPVEQPIQVQSSFIDSITYHPDSKSLDVAFARGNVYSYGCIDKPLFRQLVDSDSKGRFFGQNIRSSKPFLRAV